MEHVNVSKVGLGRVVTKVLITFSRVLSTGVR